MYRPQFLVPMFTVDSEQIINLEKFKKLIDRRINVKFEYCSIVDECWEEERLKYNN